MNSSCLTLISMGVINLTPDSFSDGREVTSLEVFLERLEKMGKMDILDLGAESTAPMNSPISAEEEWRRLSPFLTFISQMPWQVSCDTYHPETIFKLAELWLEQGHERTRRLIWNDVSGKFDQHVEKFLQLHPSFRYVYCHNLAPTRPQSGAHLEFTSLLEGEAFFQHLAQYFRPYLHPQVVFDPCLGFSKSYEQNWQILQDFARLTHEIEAPAWMLGFSRKSFLRKKFQITLQERVRLDQTHLEVLASVLKDVRGKIIVRTHRPELLRLPGLLSSQASS